MEWIRNDPKPLHGNARALRACIWIGLDKWSPARNLLPWHRVTIFIRKSGTNLSSFAVSIEMMHSSCISRKHSLSRKRNQLTCRPHPLDLAAKSHSMRSSIIAKQSKQPVLPSWSQLDHDCLARHLPMNWARFRRTICWSHKQSCLRSTRTVPSARTWTTWQDATCGVRHTEVLHVVPVLKVKPRIPTLVCTHILVQWYAVVLCVRTLFSFLQRSSFR